MDLYKAVDFLTAVCTGPDWVWQESPAVKLAPGLTTDVEFALAGGQLKSAATKGVQGRPGEPAGGSQTGLPRLGGAGHQGRRVHRQREAGEVDLCCAVATLRGAATAKFEPGRLDMRVAVWSGWFVLAGAFLLALGVASCSTAPGSQGQQPARAGAQMAGQPQAAAEATATGRVDPANLIPHRGKRIFLSGMNLAWMDYARDLDHFNETRFVSQVENISSAGGNTIRWWVLVNASRSPTFGDDGLVKELPAEQILAVKRALDIAFQRGVGLILCLFSFDLLQNQAGVGQARNKRLIEDKAATQTFIDRALIPLVRKVKNHPGLIAWEIFNEPEGMLPSFGWTPQRTSMEAVQAFINRVAGAIHREAPGNLVTNGSWNIQVLTTVGGLVNYYTDEALTRAGGDPDGTLDFYSVHYYPEYFDETLSPFHNPKSHWGLDKPLVIAEFPSKGIIPILGKTGFVPQTRLTTEEAYRYALEQGYAGALSWTMTNHDGYGGFFHSREAMSSLFVAYGDYIALERIGLDLSPRVVTPVKDVILGVVQRSWPDVLALTEYVQDPEDRTALTFVLTDPGDPTLAQITLSTDGKVSASLPEGGTTGSMRVTALARDKSENETAVSFVVHVVDPDRGNVALLKPVTASTTEMPDNLPQYLNDGNPKTRWSSLYQDEQWCMIDLQGLFHVTDAVLSWEAAYGRVYEVQGSTDGQTWTTLASVTEGKGGVERLDLGPADVRYVRMVGKTRGTQWGFSLWEMEVTGERVR